MRIMLINDDEGTSAYETDDIREVFPDADVRRFDSAFDAWRSGFPAQLIVIDLSAVGSILIGPSSCYSAICSLAGKFPGAPIIINSAVSKNFSQEVADLVIERCPDSVVRLVDWTLCDPHESFVSRLREFVADIGTSAIRT